MSEETRFPLDGEQHLPHEAWHIVQQKYGDHFDDDGNPLPGAEQHLPHEAWHIVQQKREGHLPHEAWHAKNK